MNSSLKFKEDVFFSHLDALLEKKVLPEKYHSILKSFYFSYKNAVENTPGEQQLFIIFETFLELLKEQFERPFAYPLYHQKIRSPFDYYQFGLDFLRPLIIPEKSKAFGLSQVGKMAEQVKNGENVIFFANHQIESDPQAISLLLGKEFALFASSIIYVAGERVIKDPLAMPFSKGCDMICIYSKNYLENSSEEREQKKSHNTKAMVLMSSLLKEGGKAIFVAPSGGRDRIDETGQIKMAPFDPESLEIFTLMALRSKKKCHFYPLSLFTYHVMPPPEKRHAEVGEIRSTRRSPIYLYFGDEIDMDNIPSSPDKDKKERRKERAVYIEGIVEKNYQKLIKEDKAE